MKFLIPSIISGTLSTIGGSWAKIGFDFSGTGMLATLAWKLTIDYPQYTPYLYVLLHTIMIALTILFNTAGISYFAKSIHENGSAKATVYNFWVIFISGVVSGILIFEETLTLKSLIGIVFMIVGVYIISSSEDYANNSQKQKDE